MDIFFKHLSDPEYMHVLLNPLPVYGLATAVIGLTLALIFRRRPAIIIALALVFISGISAWPVLSYGQAAYDRVKSMSDPAGEQWLDEHMERGEKLIYAFYVLAGLAIAGMIVPIKWPRTATPLATTTLVLGFATLGIGGWISYAGGHVRHKEFRFESPPPARAEEHDHGDEQHAADSHQHAPEESPAESAQPQMEHADHDKTPNGAEQPKTEEEKKQLEASRLQLEASRLQLEASRKQLEASGGGASPSASQSASPSVSPEHKHDEHPH
jgi:hypothetical protein